MTALAQTRPEPAPAPDRSGAQRLVLYGISWPAYRAIADALGEQPVHLTYDRGALEFMTLSPEHERYKSLLGILVNVLAEELDVRIASFGSMTHQREDLQRGLEPDECYYHHHLPAMRGKRRLDLVSDPPPDLVVEVDVSRSSLNRMAIYGALGVPEVWRFDGTDLRAFQRKLDGEYQEVPRSPTFPGLAVSGLVRFLRQGEAEDDTTMIRAFRAWVREQLAGGTRP